MNAKQKYFFKECFYQPCYCYYYARNYFSHQQRSVFKKKLRKLKNPNYQMSENRI